EVSADGSDEPSLVEPSWGRYVAGVVRALAEADREPIGLEGALSSSVPVGAGLSSSAALEVACALALCTVAAFHPDERELARLCQRAEHIATGVPCGIMDQLVSLLGVSEAALLIDCRTLEVRAVPLPHEIEVVAVHSGLPRELRSSEYAQRRSACEEVAARLGLPALRDA